MTAVAARTDHADVIIAGGGLAGSALAVQLGRAGLDVELHERDHHPREKACGEGLMPAGVGVLRRLGLLEAVGGTPLVGLRYWGWGRTIATSFPAADGRPACGLGQRRSVLDAAVFGAAQRTPGVTAYEGSPVLAPVLEAGRIRGVQTAHGVRRARLVVAADGALSPLRRAVGLQREPARSGRVGVRRHFRLAPGRSPGAHVQVFMGGGHELYLTPLPRGEVLVAGLSEDGGGPLRDRFAQWTGEHATLADLLDEAEPITEILGRAPLAARARAGVLPGLVLLGDAAGFTDPVTGGGMAQALLSAELLTKYLLDGAPFGGMEASTARLEAFDDARRKLLRDYRLLTAFVLRLVRQPRLGRASLQAFGRFPGLFQHLVGVAGGAHALVPG